jgi:hypothetical protein
MIKVMGFGLADVTETGSMCTGATGVVLIGRAGTQLTD